jgi:hypothetical protein
MRVFSSADDHVLLAVHDADKPFRADLADVARTKPAIAKCLLRDFTVVLVTLYQVGTSNA